MFRKNKEKQVNRKLHFGIRPKMFLGLFAVFAICAVVLQVVLTHQLSQSMEDQIFSDLTKLQSTTEVYSRQILLQSHFGVQQEMENEAEAGREALITGMAAALEELYANNNYMLAVYNTERELIHAAVPSYFMGNSFPQKAYERAEKEGRAAYELTYNTENECHVYLVMPIRMNEAPIGYVAYYINYAELQMEKYETVQTVLQITLVVMAMALLFSILVLTHFIQPIRRLTAITGRFTKEGIDSKDLEKQKEELSRSLARRHDEVGDLSRNYFEMLGTIQSQITHIQEDRNHIFQLLNSRQAFFDNVTHELKTPLTTIQGYAQLIQDGGDDDAELLETGLDHILKESTRLHAMVLQLLEMSNKQLHYRLEPLSLTPILTSVVEAMELKANRYQSHLCLACPQQLIVRGQEDRLRQLLINLIDNAIKYGQPGEAIEITAGRRKKGEDGALLPYLCVANKGKGMTAAQVAHIFEPFYRVDKNYSREQGSSGLGLAICQKIVQEHQASIEVESEPGGLTQFTVWFEQKGGEEQ